VLSVVKDAALHQTTVDVIVDHLKSIDLELGRFTNSCVCSAHALQLLVLNLYLFHSRFVTFRTGPSVAL
jgi:hypothetical protein